MRAASLQPIFRANALAGHSAYLSSRATTCCPRGNEFLRRFVRPWAAATAIKANRTARPNFLKFQSTWESRRDFHTPSDVTTGDEEAGANSSQPRSAAHAADSSNNTLQTTAAVQQAVSVLAQNEEEAAFTLPHPVWNAEELERARIFHVPPTALADRLAYIAVKTMRTAFDLMSGYAFGRIDERGWLNRIVYLETVAGVPGMVGAGVRHLRSLGKMERDHGWIHTLLEEAENERMHLMTALVLKNPTLLFRGFVMATQGIFLMGFGTAYLISPRFAHRFVAYLEEEAVVTYTKLLHEIDNGHLPLFTALPAPTVAVRYWELDKDAMFRDVVLAIRADEHHHGEVNHTLAELPPDSPNPYLPGH